jgi:hypothetical protein
LEDQRYKWLTTDHGLFMGHCCRPIRHIRHRSSTFRPTHVLLSKPCHDILTSKSNLIRPSRSSLSFSARCRSYHGFRSSCTESKTPSSSHPFSKLRILSTLLTYVVGGHGLKLPSMG